MTPSLNVMTSHVEATLLQRELLTNFRSRVTIGLPFTKILEDTPIGVTSAKGWGNRDEMPLHPQVALEPFDKWGMELVGPVDPPSRQKKNIMVCTDYLTK